MKLGGFVLATRHSSLCETPLHMIILLWLSLACLSPVNARAEILYLEATIRDFNAAHPDFEQNISAVDPGIVAPVLGSDHKPVYAGGLHPTTHDAATFDQWYHNVPGVNVAAVDTMPVDNTVTADRNVFTFSDADFFPLDGSFLGNEGLSHNYHFTVELHTEFVYHGGERLVYTADDDLWVFINDQLVVDLGGIHTAETRTVDLDNAAAGLGLVRGNAYRFDLFFAERQTAHSVLRFDVPRSNRVTVNPENGVDLPARGHVRVFVVFAEVDFQPCGSSDQGVPNWPKGQLPTFRDTLFDNELTAGGVPTGAGYVTDYFYQMSGGQYVVLGDYVPNLVTLNCNPRPGTNEVLTAVAQQQPITSAHGYQLPDFDLWQISAAYAARAGRDKTPTADNLIDLMLIVWRNYNSRFQFECITFGGDCNSGFISGESNTTLGTTNGLNNVGQFWNYGGDSIDILLHEYVHALLGGNNWHLGGGADRHSVHVPQGAYGLLAHYPAVSAVASGWDRDRLGWHPPGKDLLISALSVDGDEVKTDITVQSHPLGGRFVLRDFVKFGDAIRIKLPHIDWQTLGDNKNQYLWLENHQRLSRFDINGRSLTDVCHKKWSPGMYAQIQVGKDVKTQDVNNDGVADNFDVYPGAAQSPNGLGSYLIPLTAEGNFDFSYRLDQVTGGDGLPCQYNNISIPLDQSMSLPNPFTGYAEVYQQIDADVVLSSPLLQATFVPFGNGRLFDNDGQYVLTEFRNGQVVRELPGFGDARDAFGSSTGKTRLGIDTNPAPVPMYTNTSASGFGSPRPLTGATYENRTLWLNGLSVQIVDELTLGPTAEDGKALVVDIRWDDYKIKNDVRWTGNIVLQNDTRDPYERKARIVVASCQVS